VNWSTTGTKSSLTLKASVLNYRLYRRRGRDAFKPSHPIRSVVSWFRVISYVWWVRSSENPFAHETHEKTRNFRAEDRQIYEKNLRFLLLERNSGAALVTAPPATTDHLSPVTRLRARLLRASWESGAHGRGCGVGRGLGVALGGAVGVGVGDSGIEGVGVGDGGIVAVGVAEGVGVGVGVTGGGVGVGVGVVPGTQGVTVGVGVGVAGGGVGGGFPTAVAILTRPQP
jgi:hypothetical protein